MLFFDLHMKIAYVFHFFRRPSYGNYETNFFRRETFFYGQNRRHYIAVACYQHSGVKSVIIGALKEFDRYIHVCLLFLVSLINFVAKATTLVSNLKFPKDNFDPLQS